MPPKMALSRLAQSLSRPRRCHPPLRTMPFAALFVQMAAFTPSVSRTGTAPASRSPARPLEAHPRLRVRAKAPAGPPSGAAHKSATRHNERRHSPKPSRGPPSRNEPRAAEGGEFEGDGHERAPDHAREGHFKSVVPIESAAASPETSFEMPRSGAAAAALLGAATMLEALSLPPSAASFSLPATRHGASLTGVDAAQEASTAAQATFMKLRTAALPLLFDFAEQQTSDVSTEGLCSPAGRLCGPPVRPSEAQEALQCLADHLSFVKQATRRDGRRHVSALPPPVVAALWDRVMPFLHSQAFPRGSRGDDQHPPGGVADGGASGSVQLREAEHADGGHEARRIANAAACDASTSESGEAQSLALVSSSPQAPTMKLSYLAARRALALHTRSIASLMPPDVVVMVLTRLYQCGALSDDILGPVVSDMMEKQKQARRLTATTTSVGGAIMILQRRVLRLDDLSKDGNAAPSAPATFEGASAISMARLLGKASIPGHHQLHRLLHFALLPEVTRVLRATATAVAALRGGEASGKQDPSHAEAGAAHNDANADAAVALPGVDALLDLTSAFRQYAVSGEAVQHLTTLWELHFELVTQVSWNDCAAVLRALSTLPIASSRSQRRQARQLPRTTGGRQDKLLLRMAEDDYFPLIECVCAWVRRLSTATVASFGSSPQALDAATPATAAAASSASGMLMAAAVPPAQLLGLLRMLLRVNSPHWADTYEALATAVLVQLAPQHPSPAAGAPSPLTARLPLADTQRTLRALLHRNSLIPDHPLHRVLLRRVLYAPEALTDVSAATIALLGLEVMIPANEGSVRVSPADTLPDTQTASLVEALPLEDLTITPHDRVRALQLLRRYGRSMSPTAFIAGLCVAPIHQLPLATQSALVNHLSSVATAVSPAHLVKGMVAVMSQLSPTAIDDVSVKQWYSRFTAVDVVRRVDGAGCALLLDMLSANPRFALNCALAKQAITRQIGVALLRSGDVDGAATGDALGLNGVASASLTLEQLTLVVSALRRANVFHPLFFSRVCRLMLSQVEAAPLGELLTPFSTTAEEFMQRHQREGQASVFKDVWELLRGRVLDQVATLSVEETCTALNAFAALDVCDDALFGVVVHHLWACVQRDALEVEANPQAHPSTVGSAVASASELSEGGEYQTQEVKLMSQAGSTDPSNDPHDEAQEAMVRRVAQLGQHITRALTPSAVAVVVTTLCAREDAMAHTMLPWMLLALRDCHTELYPIDAVHVLPPLLKRYTAASMQASDSPTHFAASSSAPLADAGALSLLHAALDAVRSTFLSMYAVVPEPAALSATSVPTGTKAATAAATAVRNRREQSALTHEEVQRISMQRAEWTPAVKLSVQVVPRPWFATILITLCSADLVDVEVSLACVERACTRRVCGTLLPVDQLVTLCLSMCWLLRASDAAMGRPQHAEMPWVTGEMSEAAAASADETAAVDVTSGDSAMPRTAMAIVLSSLWYRSDELSTAQINALLRCLRATYGADRVDDDFVQRLELQKARIQKRRSAAAAATTMAREAAEGIADRPTTASEDNAAATAPPPETQQMLPDDLFSMM
ncbi:hypothetical protein ABL78_6476 [Leptomonas seymouri]|uniref:Uncharacterized protein n=1 Tax=Leptomonas seymouri TaxID=5684 RepID=A0A0N1PCX3_LEPSE|nr:hypothetical protein ABL78_6476 [Leptomonas seymouri]|eukprot:KPI84470.1 hypothetical protein ABL78_6476 [Leptomonas seymouri]